MKIQLSELRQTTKQALTNYGYTPDETSVLLEVLLYAQMRGNNQGVVKLTDPAIKRNPSGEITIEKETKVSALLDAKQNHAMIVASRACAIAVAKAKEHGIAVVGAHGISSSSGALGYYMQQVAEQGLVGLMYVSAGLPTVAAAGSYEAILGTNPLAIGVPGNDGPLVLDMATAAMAYYGVVEAKTAGTDLPVGVAFDKNGQETTSPEAVLDDGALRPFDKSYKSSNLSIMVQILAGPLVGAAFMGEGDMANNWAGDLIIAIDPEILNGTENVRAGIATIIEKVKATKKLPGTEEILMPSERGNRLAKQVEESGEIEIEDNLWAKLQDLAKPTAN